MPIDFLTLLKQLAATDLEFVIVGGVAARAHVGRRLTHDVDIVPRLEARPWARMVDLLWNAGARPRIPESREAIQDPSNVRRWMAEKNLLALSFRSTDGAVEVDLLVSESNRVDELLERAVRVEIDGVSLAIASIEDLIEMKRRAGRQQDLLDIEELELIMRQRG